MKNILALRLCSNILLLLSAVLLPWWLTIILVIFAVFYFENFLEALFFGLILDSLYGQGRAWMLHQNILFLLTVVLLLVISIFVKKRLKFYE